MHYFYNEEIHEFLTWHKVVGSYNIVLVNSSVYIIIFNLRFLTNLVIH